MKMSNHIGLCAMGFALAITACGGDSDPSTAQDQDQSKPQDSTTAEPTPDMTIAAVGDLPNCTEKREGETALVTKDSASYLCNNGKWVFVSAPTPTVETLDDLSNCSSKAEGDTVKVSSESALFRCENGKWEKYRTLTDTLTSEDDLLACVSKREGNTAYIVEEHALFRCEEGIWNKTVTFMDSTSSIDNLPNCTSKNEDDSTYVKNENSVYLCIDDAWRYLGTVSINSDELPNCTDKREGNKAFVAAEHITLICNDGKWYRYDIYKFIDSENTSKISSSSSNSNNTWEEYSPASSSNEESSSEKSSSSQKIEDKSSSSEKVVSSSSTVLKSSSSEKLVSSSSTAPKSSSSEKKVESSSSEEESPVSYPVVKTTKISSYDCSYAMYCPQDCQHTLNTTRCGKVYTGVDDGEGNQGYLWSYTDADANDGTSYFDWPAGLDAYDSFETPSRDDYGYLKGSIEFGDGYDYPYGRIGFHIKGRGSSTDITAWKGMCIIYKATQDFLLRIQVDKDDKFSNFDDYQAKIPASSSMVLVNVAWTDFIQEGWGKAFSRADALSMAQTILFNFKGDAGTSNEFSIYAIGKYGTCN